ncbi:MAG: hypothetical protein AAF547_12435 [Actinomycetota bacterium]
MAIDPNSASGHQHHATFVYLFHLGHSTGDGTAKRSRDLWEYLFEPPYGGLTFESGAGATACWDWEDMEPLGIPEFEPGAHYLVGAMHDIYLKINPPLHFYSPTEFKGWLNLMVSSLILDNPNWAPTLLQLERTYYDPNQVAGLIPRKLAGELPWDCGYPDPTKPPQ